MTRVKPIPDGMHSLTPHLVCEGAAEAIAFYVRAFDAIELARLKAPDGRIAHACLRIGDSALMLADAFPECGGLGPGALKGSPVLLHLYVEDVDAVMAQAQAAGATITMPPADMFWGDRYGQLTDPLGHKWSVATHRQELTQAQIEENMKAAFAQLSSFDGP
ncbi:VOC family protein [Bordetella sp. 15P40C-2]|uniref:VOC family protein n=1 Tax=Bordetella sp. 15P40C-2 TaxID=2572246 RepID=UPI001320FEEA|nr:VOC family protein [Bordetella sp. 15P40C-2]MVW69966.1 VOC family protein [Bordetella sp. 15P40C-2]